MTLPPRISLYNADEWRIRLSADGNIGFGSDRKGSWLPKSSTEIIYNVHEWFLVYTRGRNVEITLTSFEKKSTHTDYSLKAERNDATGHNVQVFY